MRRIRSLLQRDKKKKERDRAPPCAQGNVDGYERRGGGTPEWGSDNPEVHGLFVNGNGRSNTHHFFSGMSLQLYSEGSSIVRGTLTSPEAHTAHNSGDFPETQAGGREIPRGGYGGATTPTDSEDEAAERARLQRMVEQRSGKTSVNTTTEPSAERDCHADCVLLFRCLPRFGIIRVQRGATGTLGFHLQVKNFTEEVSLPIVCDVEPTAIFIPPEAVLQKGDVLLAANGHIIAGLPKQTVQQTLKQTGAEEVELAIIRSPVEFDQLCQIVRDRFRASPSITNSEPTERPNTGGCSIEREDDEDDGPVPEPPPPVSSASTVAQTERQTNEQVVITDSFPNNVAAGGGDAPMEQRPPPREQCPLPTEQRPSFKFDLTDEELNRMDKIELVDVKCEHKVKFGTYLDVEDRYWKIIAESGGIPPEEIKVIKPRLQDGRCTEEVLRRLEEGRLMTLGRLCRIIRDFGRMDVIEYVKLNIVKEIPEMERKEAERIRRSNLPPSSGTPGSSLSSVPYSKLENTTGYTTGYTSICSSDFSPISSTNQLLVDHEAPLVLPPVSVRPLQSSAATVRKGKARAQPKCGICSQQHDEYVYISYARDMIRYVENVMEWLLRNGMAVHIDRMDEAGRAAKVAPVWKTEQLDGAKFILVLCSPGYIRQLKDDRLDNRCAVCQPGCGVSFDINYIAKDIFLRNGNYRCIPVLVNGFTYDCVPSYLGNTHVFRYPDQEASIWRRLTNTREFELPPLGPRRVIKPRKEW